MTLELIIFSTQKMEQTLHQKRIVGKLINAILTIKVLSGVVQYNLYSSTSNISFKISLILEWIIIPTQKMERILRRKWIVVRHHWYLYIRIQQKWRSNGILNSINIRIKNSSYSEDGTNTSSIEDCRKLRNAYFAKGI